MVVAFYLSSLVAILATLRIITSTNPVHALLYMVVSLMSASMIFFALGAPFAGALEIIVYAGAIMILFVFVVMMLNLGEETIHQERTWLTPKLWRGPALLTSVLFFELFFALYGSPDFSGAFLGTGEVNTKQVGIALFGPNLLLVELASILLLAALVAAFHLGRTEE